MVAQRRKTPPDIAALVANDDFPGKNIIVEQEGERYVLTFDTPDVAVRQDERSGLRKDNKTYELHLVWDTPRLGVNGRMHIPLPPQTRYVVLGGYEMRKPPSRYARKD